MVKNYGFLGSGQTPRDYIFGAESPIKLEVLQPNGQWDDFLVEKEYQNQPDEKMFCVTASALNCLEILHKRKYGIEINFNDAYTAKSSGTTRQGNTMYNVAESIRKNDGVIEQSLWKPNNVPWDVFYAPIPKDIRDKALWNINEANDEGFFIQYQWIKPSKENLLSALKYAPIQIAVYTNWYQDSKGIWHLREIQAPTHCLTLIGYKEGEYMRCFDSYLGNEIRDLAWDYFIGYAMQFNLTKYKFLKNMPQELYKKKGTNKIYYKGADGKYHWIVNEATFVRLFGSFESAKIIEVDITPQQEGEAIALIIN